MYVLMYAFAIIFAFGTIVAFQDSILFSVILCFLAVLFWFLGSSEKAYKERAQIISTKKRLDEDKKWRKINDEIPPIEEKPEKNKCEDENFIGTCAGSILALLELQISLLSHIKDIKQNHFTIGYTFGLVDGLMQANDIDINDEVAWRVMHLVLEGQYSKKETETILNIYEEQTQVSGSLLLRGMQVGGEEFLSQLPDGPSHVGLLEFFDDEDEIADVNLDKVSTSTEVDDQENDIQVRLEKLSKLYRDKLITKKVYEDKQAKILAEL